MRGVREPSLLCLCNTLPVFNIFRIRLTEMTEAKLELNLVLLVIFIAIPGGCSRSIHVNNADSNGSASGPIVTSSQRGTTDLNEDLMTIPVASYGSEPEIASDTDAHDELFSGEFTESAVTETFESGQTRMAYQVRQYGDEQVRHGQYSEFYESGTLFLEGTFHHDRRHGVWRYFHESGQPARVAEYDGGLPSGDWQWYSEEGTLFRTAQYQNGRKSGLQETYWPGGTVVKLQEHFIDDAINGIVRGFNESGQKVLELEFVDGKPHGPETRWFSNGAIAATGNYTNGVPDGLFVYYDADGAKTSEVHWTDGQRTPGFKPSISK